MENSVPDGFSAFVVVVVSRAAFAFQETLICMFSEPPDAPEIDRSPAFGKAAADKGGTAVLVCRAEGAPEVAFSWFRVSPGTGCATVRRHV